VELLPISFVTELTQALHDLIHFLPFLNKVAEMDNSPLGSGLHCEVLDKKIDAFSVLFFGTRGRNRTGTPCGGGF